MADVMGALPETAPDDDNPFVLRVCIDTIPANKSHIPANLEAKQLALGERDGVLNAVVNVQGVPFLSPPEVHSGFCASIGLVYPEYIVRDLCRGILSDDLLVIVDDAEGLRVVWFALNKEDAVVIVDIASWDIFPNVKVYDFSCVANSVKSRAHRRTHALQELSQSVDAIGPCLTDASYKTIQDRLKRVYDEFSIVG